MPEWQNKWQTEGKTANEVKELMDQKKIKYVQNWGNKSRLGAFITDKFGQLYKIEEELKKPKPKRMQTIDAPRASHGVISKTPLDVQ